MNIPSTNHHVRGVTAIEVIMIIAALLMIAAVMLPLLAKKHSKSSRIACVNNIKQVCLAFTMWSGDNHDRFPMEVPISQDGTKGFIGVAAATFRHFQVMSNELGSPKVLYCPSESDVRRHWATTFGSEAGTIPFTGNSNVSYFVGVDVTLTNRATFLVGDRHITNGLAINNGLLELNTNRPAAWTSELHNGYGYLGFPDGSAQQATSQGLRELLKQTGAETTRLAMP